MKTGDPLSSEVKTAIFSESMGFNDLPSDAYKSLAELADSRRFAKNAVIFRAGEPCRAFYLVGEGLVRISICSLTGKRLTYLLVRYGEPLNLVGPFTGEPRLTEAEAAEDSIILSIKREKFIPFAFAYPQVVINIIRILGQAVDSANTRILDMMEKKVEYRLMRALFTLYNKFGARLSFTSTELAELAGTTTESALRALSRLREKTSLKPGGVKFTLSDQRN